MSTRTNRFEHLHSRFILPEEMRSSTKYPQRSQVEASSVFFDNNQSELLEGFALNLASQTYSRPDTPWLEVHKPIDSEPCIEVNIINPVSAHRLGESALIDSVILERGDVFRIGRLKYPELSQKISRTHTVLSYDHSRLLIEDRSRNGMHVSYPRPMRAEPKREPYSFGEQYFNWNDQWDEDVFYDSFDYDQFSGGHESGFVSHERLMRTYSERFSSLSEADFVVCYQAIETLRAILDSKKRERELFRHFHPDRNRLPNGRVANEIYLLLRAELGFEA